MLRAFNSNSSLKLNGRRCKEPINVDFQMESDKNIGEAPRIAEEFPQVILNLCNNAFDAMREKTLQGFSTLGGLEQYHPKLSARTKFQNGQTLIEIEGNGPGIPNRN